MQRNMLHGMQLRKLVVTTQFPVWLDRLQQGFIAQIALCWNDKIYPKYLNLIFMLLNANYREMLDFSPGCVSNENDIGSTLSSW